MPNLSPISSKIQVVDKFSKSFSKMNAGLGRVNASTKRLRNGFMRLNQEANVGKNWKNLKTQTGTLSRRFMILGGAAVGAGAGLYALVNRTAQVGDTLAKNARAIGMSAQMYQELQFAADRSGIANQAFATGMLKAAQNVGLLKSGTGSLYTLLSKTDKAYARQVIGISDTGEAVESLLNHMAGIEDPTKRAAFAAAAFGRSGVQLANLATEGAEGIAKLRAEYRRLGGTIGDDAAKASEAFIDQQLDMKVALTGLRNTIGFQLMPQFTAMAKRFTEFIVNNRGKFAAFSRDFAAKLPARLEKLTGAAMGLGKGLLALARVVDRIANAVGGYENLVKGAIALMAVKWVFAIGKMGASLISFSTTAIPMAISGLSKLIPMLSTASGLSMGAGAGLAGQAGLVGLAGAGGYAVGWGLNKGMGALSGKMTDGKHKGDGWLGSMIYDATHNKDFQRQRDQHAQKSEVLVRFENAPKGTRLGGDYDNDLLKMSMGYAMATQ
jgi:hypothetical protein